MEGKSIGSRKEVVQKSVDKEDEIEVMRIRDG